MFLLKRSIRPRYEEVLDKPAFKMAFGIWGVKTVLELLSLSKEDLDKGGKVVKLCLMERKKILDVQGWYFLGGTKRGILV
jgi:hypothetical protein